MRHSPFHHIHSHIRALRSRNGISTSESPNLHKLNANLFILIFATVANSYPNRTVTAKFVPTAKEITITLYFAGDEFMLNASSPVTTDIVVRQTIHYLEENVCDGYINSDSDMDIEVIIPKGQTAATYKVSMGNDSCTTTSLTFSKEIYAPWIGKTINGAVYKISGNWLM